MLTETYRRLTRGKSASRVCLWYRTVIGTAISLTELQYTISCVCVCVIYVEGVAASEFRANGHHLRDAILLHSQRFV